MLRVVLMEDYLDAARELACVKELRRRAELQIYTTRAGSEAEVEARLRGADIAITIRDRVMFTPALLARLGHLKLLSICGPRVVPHVDVAAASRAGIPVCTSPRSATPWSAHSATAELTFGLILGLAKDTLLNARALREDRWQTRPGRGLAGKTLGIIGLGKVGGLVAAIARAMQMRVIAWGPRLTPEKAAAAGAQCVPFEAVFSDADVVSLHANLTDESRSLVGARELERMRPHALLINTARAGLVDEQALRRALEEGGLAGAGLDVYWEEPLPPGHWLRRRDNVLLQPHIGGFSEEGYEDIVAPGVENVLAFLEGRPQNVVNPQVLKPA
jgi:phosphoglycerate dehydrogenase-like enzyme